jgi:hypothetical protein
MTPITQADMEAVFAVTDELGLHREHVTVPLARREPGGVRRVGPNDIQITLPPGVETALWCEEILRPALRDLGYEELP